MDSQLKNIMPPAVRCQWYSEAYKCCVWRFKRLKDLRICRQVKWSRVWPCRGSLYEVRGSPGRGGFFLEKLMIRVILRPAAKAPRFTLPTSKTKGLKSWPNVSLVSGNCNSRYTDKMWQKYISLDYGLLIISYVKTIGQRSSCKPSKWTLSQHVSVCCIDLRLCVSLSHHSLCSALQSTHPHCLSLRCSSQQKASEEEAYQHWFRQKQSFTGSVCLPRTN